MLRQEADGRGGEVLGRLHIAQPDERDIATLRSCFRGFKSETIKSRRLRLLNIDKMRISTCEITDLKSFSNLGLETGYRRIVARFRLNLSKQRLVVLSDLHEFVAHAFRGNVGLANNAAKNAELSLVGTQAMLEIGNGCLLFCSAALQRPDRHGDHFRQLFRRSTNIDVTAGGDVPGESRDFVVPPHR